jgi:dephospho-CoA kinase
MNKILIGLTGEIGSGKTIFYDLLKEFLPDQKIVLINYSDTLKETLNLWYLDHTRENFKKLAIAMNSNFGDASLAHATTQKALKTDCNIAVLAGLRWMGDLERLKVAKGLLVYVTADEKTRFERVKKRTEKSDEPDMTYQEFEKANQASNEVTIPKIGKEADFMINNNGSLEEFKSQVKEFIDKFL